MRADRSMTILLWIIGVALVLVGLAGVVLPALPGTILIFGGLLVIAWIDNFTRVGPGALVLIGLIAVASHGVDFAAAALGAKRLGASPRAMIGAALGTIAGLFFGLPGVVLGPFAGAVIGELTVQRDLARAGRAGLAAWIGFVVGMAVKVGLAFLMIAIFIAAFAF
jgi:uncharacterized protein YqgC (DUF456 family)